MLDCDQALELISRSLDEPLSPEEDGLLSQHLSACAECAALARDFSTLHEGLDAFPAPVPENFAQGVMERIRLESSAAPPRGNRLRWKTWGSLAAALCLVALGAFRLLPVLLNSGGSMAVAVPQAAVTSTDAVAPAGGGGGGESDSSHQKSSMDDGYGSEERAFLAPAPAPSPEEGERSDALLGASMVSVSRQWTPQDAGAYLLSAAFPEEASAGNYAWKQKEDGSLLLAGSDSEGVQLVYTGLSEDESLYCFDIIQMDGTVQKATVSLNADLPDFKLED
ncbi:hypothetical protein SDC9_89433 [bioreactor metagenome]|uniref:Putative zinc-finger domain-containing protein n=1 Tax=bioreactor metagenome TaxID=1076179 RepID=A0A644ZPI9_9ZZZZ